MPGVKATKRAVAKSSNPHRPTYKRAYDNLIIETFKRGGTLAEFCTHPDVMTGRQTVYGWYSRYPTFREAYDIARELAKLHHEQVVNANLLVDKEAASTFDMNTFIKTSGVRFADMRTERPVDDIIDDKDLMKSVKNLANAAAQNMITQEQVRNISLLLQQASQLKEQQELVARIEKLEHEDDENGNAQEA